MKNIFKVVLMAAVMATFSRCSDNEQIEPTSPADDLTTSANAYQDQFLTFSITTNYDRDIRFHLVGNGGKVSVNWGDGTIEKIIVTDDYTEFTHDYDREKNYTINISGEIKTITEIDFNYEDLIVRNIHFGGLPELKNINMNIFANGPKVVNLSRNKKLEYITLAGIVGMEDIILSTTNEIRSIDISGESSLSTAVVNRVVARIHDSVVNSPRSGFMNLAESWYPEEGDNSMVGPPSSYSVNKLRKLRDVYGWSINPDFQ